MFLLVTLLAQEAPEAAPRTECREDSGTLVLTSRGRPVLTYHTAIAEPPPGIDAVYRRSGFLHPVQTPSGRVVTSGFPADHAHQHGIFNAWVNTTFDGRSIDFWNQKGRTGAVEHVRVVDRNSGDASASFTVELRHSDLTAPAGPLPVLQERWRVTLHDDDSRHVFDIESRQTCVAASPLVINEYHYGGMALRGCDSWYSEDKAAPTDFQFLTSEGLDRVAGNHSRPRWVAAYGTVDGATCGIAVLSHSSNLRHPEPVRLHPSKPYFAFSPCVLGEFRLEPSVEHTSRYRYIVFDGTPDAAALDAEWKRWGE